MTPKYMVKARIKQPVDSLLYPIGEVVDGEPRRGRFVRSALERGRYVLETVWF